MSKNREKLNKLNELITEILYYYDPAGGNRGLGNRQVFLTVPISLFTLLSHFFIIIRTVTNNNYKKGLS